MRKIAEIASSSRSVPSRWRRNGRNINRLACRETPTAAFAWTRRRRACPTGNLISPATGFGSEARARSILQNCARCSRDRPARAQAPAPPVDPNSPPIAAFWEIGANIPGGLPLTPWAAELKKQRMAADMKDNPDANCLPMGLTQFHTHGQPRKVMQNASVIAIMYEANYGLRYVYVDGRTLPPQGSVQPFWYGYSVGRWEGDTLVVETNNLRGAETGPYDGWLDVRGSPYTEQARFIERIRRPTYGKLEIDITLDDSKAYTKPFTVRVNQQISPDDEIIEFICAENQQFRRRVKID